MGVEFIFG